ncbi:MAG TPA: class I SAM-dependent methyltransferase [Gaiellaceae bacterium]|nr:class I SAM-dependent methyltransferase [Gaiellaceae bacterium]
MKAYYERRAPEYDDWYLGRGRFADRDRPGWGEEVDELRRVLEALPPARTLDVACGTGFLTRHLPGEIVGLDQSQSMLEEACRQAPKATFVTGDALELPFPDGSFERVFTAHFYGHLDEDDRLRFLGEARRVAVELVVVDSALRPDVEPEEMQERILDDGSRWEVYKRYFTPAGLAAELGGGSTLLDGRWFVAVRS